jgi:hypothetical protein
MKAVLKGWTRADRAIAGAVFVSSMVAYALTISPTVGFIDSGELAAVASTMGVAHPTGYPLYTLIGRIASMLPLPFTPMQQLNALSAVTCVAAAMLAFAAFRRYLVQTGREGETGLATISAGAGALVLAFSETFWSQALVVEVYPLHALLVSAMLYIVARIRAAVREGDGTDGRWVALGCYVLGLSFGNHMTTVLLVPGLLYVHASLYRWNGSSLARLLKAGLWSLAGLSVYAVLPVRASKGPPISWGYVAELERFWWHITGKQYSVWIFSSAEAAGRQFAYFLSSLPAEFAYAGLVLAAVGLVALALRDRRLATASVIFFAVCVAYAVNYDIHDIDSYFMLAYVMAALWSAFGIRAVASWFGRSMPEKVRIASVVLVVVAGAEVWLNSGLVSQRGKHVVEDYTKRMLGDFPPGAMVLSYQWDYWVSASYYYQYVEGLRTDVAVIDKELLRRSWYLRELEGRIPWVVERARGEVDAFLGEVYKFEHELPYRSAVIEARFVGMIRAMVLGAMRDRPVYVTAEVEPEFTAGLQRVPEGLAFRLVADSGFVDTPFPVFDYRPITGSGRLEREVRLMYGRALTARAAYYKAHGRPGEAKKALDEAIRDVPGSGGKVGPDPVEAR